ncbi:MAG: signal recognition particle protein [Clostridiaceae bacterium]|nr:signal recognition particle protein [Clostridiaceae bacterium]
MAFENLSDKLQQTFKKIRGKGKVTEKDVKEAMREVKLALLEADVNFKVVKEFEKTVYEKAIGSEVLESLTPGQQIIKIIRDELVNLMGSTQAKITISPKPPTIIMMVGLNGAGKTTTSGKLANILRKQGKRPVLLSCDVYRPAAIKQLEVVGNSLNIPVLSTDETKNPVDIAKEAVDNFDLSKFDTLIIDTAGRLHVNEELMEELKLMKEAVNPTEILLVVDAMTGQDAVNVAESFNNTLGIDGIILTKLDGDTRGGAALSVKAVTGKPIKFVGMGEKLSDLEPFYPDRMASRILGMGDVLTLIDKAQEAFDEKKAAELEEKIRKSQFDLNDFLEQLRQMKKMGPLSQILGMLPGINKKALEEANIDDKPLIKTEAIILSMTPKERANPGIINSSRKRRIAQGSGTTVADVNALLKQFEQMQKMMKQFTNPKMMKKMNKFNKHFR